MAADRPAVSPADQAAPIREDRQWIADWRAGMFSSSSRDADGWPIEMHGVVESWERSIARVEQRERERDEARDALRQIKQQQPKTLETLRHHGIVFDDAPGADPSNWQHVAFTIYTDLCDVDSIARAALEDEPDMAEPARVQATPKKGPVI